VTAKEQTRTLPRVSAALAWQGRRANFPSELDLFRDAERIVDLDPEIANCAIGEWLAAFDARRGLSLFPSRFSDREPATGAHVVDPHPNETAAPEPAGDGEIEHGKIALAALQLTWDWRFGLAVTYELAQNTFLFACG
jgi:hypothetical protein